MSSARRAFALGLLAWALTTSSSSSASAQDEAPRFLDGSIDFDAERAHVRFETSGPVDAPRISSEPGALRVRFGDALGNVWLDLPGDGGAFRFVRVRPGAGDATVVVIRLTDRRELPASSLHFTREGNTIDLSIDRSLLAAARLPEIVEPAAPAAVAAPAAPAEEEADEAAPEPTPAPAPRALFAPPSSLVIGGGEPSSPAPSAATPAAEPLGVRSEGATSGRTGLLLLLAAVALVGLGLMQWARTRRARGELKPPITVLASHRISQRQQLVVVRALGQDHLLSIDGGRTERLCSMESPREAPKAEAPLEAHDRDSSPSGGDFGHQLAELLGQRRDVPLASGSGPSLQAMSFAQRNLSMSPSVPSLLQPSVNHLGGMPSLSPSLASTMGGSAAASDAVAGLIRLRARAAR